MKNSAACAKAFKTLRKKFPSSSVQWDDGPVEAIVHAHLLWNATARQANTAYRRLMKSVVDLNDLRIQLPSEVKGQVGVNYPQVDERCSRLHATLRSIYLREHDMALQSLSELGKRGSVMRVSEMRLKPDKNRYKLDVSMTVTASYQKNVKATQPKATETKPATDKTTKTPPKAVCSRSRTQANSTSKSANPRLATVTNVGRQ